VVIKELSSELEVKLVSELSDPLLDLLRLYLKILVIVKSRFHTECKDNHYPATLQALFCTFLSTDIKKGWRSASPWCNRWNRKPVSVLSCHLSSQPTPRKGRAVLLPLRTLRYTWSCWPWCRHRHMSPYGVVSSCLTVSPLPLRAVCFLLRHP